MGTDEERGDGAAEWGRTILWLTLLALPLVFTSRTTEGFELPKVALLRAAVLFLGALGLARALQAPRPAVLARRVREPIVLGILLWLASAGVSTVHSLSPRTSLLGAEGSFAGFFTLLAYGVFFLACLWLISDARAARSVLQGAVIGIGLSVAYGLVQLAGLDPVRWEAPVVYSGVARVFSTLGHPNSLAQLLAMSAPLVIAAGVAAHRSRRSGEAALLGLVAAATVGLLVLTLSRAGVLALVSGLAVLLIAWRRLAGMERRLLPLVAAAAVLIGAGLLFASRFDAGLGLRQMSARLSGAPDPQLLAKDPRGPMWTAAGQVFRDHPVTGSGLETLTLVYGRYRTPAGWLAEWGLTPRKAHNQVLDLLATRGVLGLVGLGFVCFGVIRAGRRALSLPAPDALLVLTAVAGLSAFAVHNLFHFPSVASTALALTLLAVVANGAGPPVDEAPQPGPSGLALVAAAALAAGLVYVLVIQPLRADMLAQAATVVTVSDPALAVARADAAIRLDASRPELWLRRSAAYQALARAERDGGRRRAAFGAARQSAEHALAMSPREAYGRAHLGDVLADMEREDPPLASRAEVKAEFARAHALDPVNADLLQAAAAAALAAGDLPDASAWASQAASLYPRFAPPRAVLGAVALADGRGLAAQGQSEEAKNKTVLAIALLEEALASDWRGDDVARENAASNLEKARADAAAQTR